MTEANRTTGSHVNHERDRPWMMRTYSGHSTAKASNELYRTNLSKGQTGLSIAFDLPTQTGYDPDSKLARGEVGKVGVPVVHIGHMSQLLDQIPEGYLLYLNASGPVSMTVESDVLRQAVETAGDADGENSWLGDLDDILPAASGTPGGDGATDAPAGDAP